MRVAPLAVVKTRLSAYLKQAQHDSLLITRHGRPVALVIGVEGESLEDLLTSADPEFWRMIAARRAAGKSVSAKAARRRLGVPAASRTQGRGGLLDLIGAAGRSGRDDHSGRHDEIIYGRAPAAGSLPEARGRHPRRARAIGGTSRGSAK